jgi:hypothetical protein
MTLVQETTAVDSGGCLSTFHQAGPYKQKLVKSITDFARSVGADIVGEGIERQEEPKRTPRSMRPAYLAGDNESEVVGHYEFLRGAMQGFSNLPAALTI